MKNIQEFIRELTLNAALWVITCNSPSQRKKTWHMCALTSQLSIMCFVIFRGYVMVRTARVEVQVKHVPQSRHYNVCSWRRLCAELHGGTAIGHQLRSAFGISNSSDAPLSHICNEWLAGNASRSHSVCHPCAAQITRKFERSGTIERRSNQQANSPELPFSTIQKNMSPL